MVKYKVSSLDKFVDQLCGIPGNRKSPVDLNEKAQKAFEKSSKHLHGRKNGYKPD